MKSIFLILIVVVASIYSQPITMNSDEKTINPPECGQRYTLISNNGRLPPGRVVGGRVSALGDWNWMVLMRFNGRFLCGSSLINSRWVLTAAHCTSGRTAESISVELGIHDQYEPESWVLSRSIERIIEHPSYAPISKRNDVALMKMSSGVEYNIVVGPVCLISNQDDGYVGEMATATGWGTLYSGGPVSKYLREVDLEVRSDADCVSQVASIFVHPETMICAGTKGDNEDTCQGDSGGPLVVLQPNGRYAQLGVTSWGLGCGDVGVYARLHVYVSWIAQQLQAY